jgi:hypothetical protein
MFDHWYCGSLGYRTIFGGCNKSFLKTKELYGMLDLICAYENYLTKVKQASGNTVSSYMRDIRQFAGWLHDEEECEVVDATQMNISDFLQNMSCLCSAFLQI